ncbi:MAG: RNA-binding domain-containing protein [Promethearchaeota archaeon]
MGHTHPKNNNPQEPILKIRQIEIRTFIHATESREKIFHFFDNLTGSEDNKLEIQADQCHGFYGQSITPLVLRITTQKLIKQFMLYLGEHLSEQSKRQLLRELESRLDSKFKLFLRLDKQEAVLGRLQLVSHSDVFQVIIAFFNKNPKAHLNSQHIINYLHKFNIFLGE